MRDGLYGFLRNRSIYKRVYRTNLLVTVITLLLLAFFFSAIYYATSLDWFFAREKEALNAYSDNIANELNYFDNTIISISQDTQIQNLLLNYESMSEYERYAAVDAATGKIVNQLHMIDYVTDVVLITKDYRALQAYLGPHGDFYIDEFDYVGLAHYSLSSKVNTVLADPRDYANSRRKVNQNGITYLKRVNDSENMYFNIGYILVYLDKEALFNLSGTAPDEHRYILDAGKRLIYADDPVNDPETEQKLVAKLTDGADSGERGFFLGGISLSGFPAMCASNEIQVLGWYIVATVSYISLLGGVFGFIAITVAVIALMCLVQAYISRSIANSLDVPIKQILDLLRRVETGDFTTMDVEPYHDELNVVQNSLNYTIMLLDKLFTRTRENERAKYQLQLQALHSQMNPHFLMNALNSVMWLAQLQGADNIKDFCRALSRLMQDMLKTDEFTAPLNQEISLLNDYALIMRYRYFDRFMIDYRISVPEDTLIPRSILQPLIENALQHGLGEKTPLLKITLSVHKDAAALYINVTDDGCGIPPEVLCKLFPGDDESREELKKGRSIGLRNIDQRLRLSYGVAYGLEVKSEADKYTSVLVRLPLNRQE